MSLQNIISNLNKVTGEVKKRAMAVLEVEAVKSVKKNFEQGGRPDRWIPTKKRGKAKGTKTLVISGTMSDITAEADMSKGTVTLITNPGARAYAKIQHEGGTINMPSRLVKHRKVTKGKNRGKSVFTSGSGKKTTETHTKPYQIVIPARPFMLIPPEDFSKIIERVKSAVNSL